MEKIIVRGKNVLKGSVDIHGSKNSALPILAACVAARGRTVIHNCPYLTDVRAALNILEYLGCEVETDGKGTVTVDSGKMSGQEIPENLMHEMRSSVIFMGALVSRFGSAVLSSPGGCEIGLRPIDLHILSLKSLGVSIREEHGRIYCKVKKRLKGTRIALSFPSVGATENIILTAISAVGVTTIINAAREPEITDLANFLNSCGAKISGAGEGTITVVGTGELSSTEYTVMPDRIEATTFMAAAAVTGGEITVNKVNPVHVSSVIPVFEEMGCKIVSDYNSIKISAPQRLKSFSTVRTMPYPGFPTDSQANIMAMAAYAEGTGVIIENIFESRFKHVSELNRMGAKINTEGRVAVIHGVKTLYGANVSSTDLRGGATLIVAALGAEGETHIDNVYHIDRGYFNIEERFRNLGADICREEVYEGIRTEGSKC